MKEVSHFDTEWCENIVILLCYTFIISLWLLHLKETRISITVQRHPKGWLVTKIACQRFNCSIKLHTFILGMFQSCECYHKKKPNKSFPPLFASGVQLFMHLSRKIVCDRRWEVGTLQNTMSLFAQLCHNILFLNNVLPNLN